MINYYQPFLLPFLHLHRAKLAAGVKRYVYLSMEDALWDLFTHKIKKGSTILIPDFYCMDVVINIQQHGYKTAFYPMDKHFQTSQEKLNTAMYKHKPAAIIIFHACGITNTLLPRGNDNKNKWGDILVIEDCVHRVGDPSEVSLFGDNHFIGSSLRKVSPLPGSFLYGTKKGLSFPQAKSHFFSAYQLLTTIYFFAFRFILVASTIMQLPRLTAWAHTTVLKKHDDLIGDKHIPQKSLPFVSTLSDWFNFEKIKNVKKHQVELYEKLFPNKKPFYRIKIPISDYGSLHVYPLGVEKNIHNLIPYLHNLNIIAWYKFADSPWSKQRKVLFLPLGFHITDRDIQFIADAIARAPIRSDPE